MAEQTSQPKITRHEFETKLVAKAWQDEAFKQELIDNPKAVYQRESGQQFPQNVMIQVLEEDSNTLYLVLPNKPKVSEELSEKELEAVSGGWYVHIGT
jgi:Nitrile hydratase, alpha chain